MTGQAVISFPCQWVIWDGANENELKAVAGDQFVTRDGDTAVVKGAGGRPEPMTPGWAAWKAQGVPYAVICDPEAWAAMGGPQAA